MKKSKLIVPALAMLVMSTAATVTGTVAWFSMNTAVSATNMKVKAASEGGIVISDSRTSEIWKSETSSLVETKTLYPTSTVAGSVWYHASSDSDTDASFRVRRIPTFSLLKDITPYSIFMILPSFVNTKFFAF